MKKLRWVSGDQEMPLDTGGSANFWLTFAARYVWGPRLTGNPIIGSPFVNSIDAAPAVPFIAVTFTPIGATCGRTGTTGLLKLSTRPTGLSMAVATLSAGTKSGSPSWAKFQPALVPRGLL
jgi:hypothetical protein